MKQRNKLLIAHLEAQVISTLDALRSRDKQIAMLQHEIEIKDALIKETINELEKVVGNRDAF